MNFDKFEKVKRRHMMATKAHHKMGDISRDEPDLCVVIGDDGEHWVGSWVEGFGFFHVKFPKTTTRDLTDEEIKRYDRMRLAIGSQPSFEVEIEAG